MFSDFEEGEGEKQINPFWHQDLVAFIFYSSNNKRQSSNGARMCLSVKVDDTITNTADNGTQDTLPTH